MKINSEHLYNYINELPTNGKVKFNVYYDDQYVTQIYWNGNNFEWETGTFTSEAFFNPLYDFIPIEEDKKIEKLPYYSLEKIQKARNEEEHYKRRIELLEKRVEDYHNKINELIDKVNNMENNK